MRVESGNGQELNALPQSRTTRSPAPQREAGVPARPPSAPKPEPAPEMEQAERVARNAALSEALRDSKPRMRVDSETSRIVTQLVNKNNEVVRQIPPQELLDIAARFRRLQAVLFDKRA